MLSLHQLRCFLVTYEHGSLRPRQYDVMAIVHRTGAVLSPAAKVMIDVATRHIQSITEPV